MTLWFGSDQVQIRAVTFEPDAMEAGIERDLNLVSKKTMDRYGSIPRRRSSWFGRPPMFWMRREAKPWRRLLRVSDKI
jgi:hypothetical protein